MALSGGDLTWFVYQGPPRNNGEGWFNGDRFFLSGHHLYQAKEGVELATGITGLGRETNEERYDTPADIPEANFVASVPTRRTLGCSVNILGSTPRETRENYQRWIDNHPDGEPGKLWILSSGAEPRYLYARKSADAGVGTIEKEIGLLKRIEGMEWGWTSNSPYFYGMRASHPLKRVGTTNKYQATFWNPSTVKRVYPVVYVPGPGVWELDLGGKRGKFRTPTLAANEEAMIDFAPKNNSFLKRNKDTGVVTSLWPSMVGDRPNDWLSPQTKNTYEATKISGTGTATPRIEFTPLFSSWI